ncbi:MAG: DUF1385 domain-containing protein [Armatimonadota bacterium]|nr:DUF1385 domain-containing protein [Armatimonadota bacterium]
MSDKKKKVHYGGQAVIEGVMMRGRDNFAIACRKKSNGEIVSSCEPVMSILRKLKWLNRPFLRGTLALVDAMALGMKALTFSADVAVADEEAAKGSPGNTEAAGEKTEISRKQQVVNGIAISGAMVMALALAVGLFVLIPVLITGQLRPWVNNLNLSELGRRLVLGFTEGGIKLAILLGYVSTISLWKEIRRVFEYHGAEHKTINAYEAGEPLDPEHVQKYSTVHVRCGTSFLLVVIIAGIFVFAFLSWDNLWQRFLYKLFLLPIVAGIAYEIIQFAGGRKESKFLRAVLAPGLLMQKITTKEPSDEQVEVAIKSLQLVLEQEADASAQECEETDGACCNH